MNGKRIGFIGLGVMGASMAAHLMEGGYPLTVFNRTREKRRNSSKKARHGRILRPQPQRRRISLSPSSAIHAMWKRFISARRASSAR